VFFPRHNAPPNVSTRGKTCGASALDRKALNASYLALCCDGEDRWISVTIQKDKGIRAANVTRHSIFVMCSQP
jgi:hypothetical protein